MKHTAIFTGLLLGALFLAPSCNKDDTSSNTTMIVGEVNNPNVETRKLRVITRHLYNTAYNLDSLLPDAKVYVYTSAEDRQNDENVYAKGSTNDDGEFLTTINKEYYYIKATHPSFSNHAAENVSTPPEGAVVSEVELRFIK